jgi:hypothetical protein
LNAIKKYPPKLGKVANQHKFVHYLFVCGRWYL